MSPSPSLSRMFSNRYLKAITFNYSIFPFQKSSYFRASIPSFRFLSYNSNVLRINCISSFECRTLIMYNHGIYKKLPN